MVLCKRSLLCLTGVGYGLAGRRGDYWKSINQLCCCFTQLIVCGLFVAISTNERGLTLWKLWRGLSSYNAAEDKQTFVDEQIKQLVIL